MDKIPESVYNRLRKSDFCPRQTSGVCVIVETHKREALSNFELHGTDKVNSQKVYFRQV